MRYKENGKRMIFFLGVVHPGLRLTVEIWPVIDLAHVPSDGRLGNFFLFFTKIFGWPEIFQQKKKHVLCEASFYKLSTLCSSFYPNDLERKNDAVRGELEGEKILGFCVNSVTFGF